VCGAGGRTHGGGASGAGRFQESGTHGGAARARDVEVRRR